MSPVYPQDIPRTKTRFCFHGYVTEHVIGKQRIGERICVHPLGATWFEYAEKGIYCILYTKIHGYGHGCSGMNEGAPASRPRSTDSGAGRSFPAQFKNATLFANETRGGSEETRERLNKNHGVRGLNDLLNRARIGFGELS